MKTVPRTADALAIKTNLKGREAVDDWKSYGLPLLYDVLSFARVEGHGRASVLVRDCHYRKPARCRRPARVSKVDKGQRLFGLVITPFAARYWYEVDVTVARGLNFAETADLALQAAVSHNCDLEAEEPPADEPPAATPVPSGGQAVRLMKMRDGITLLLERGQHLKELQEEKDRAAGERTRIEADTGDLFSRLEVARDHAARTDKQCQELKLRAAGLAAELANVGLAAEAAGLSSDQAKATRDKLEGEWQPHAVALVAIRQDIEHADQLMAEQQAAVAKSGDMSLLLAALEKLG